MLKIIISLGLLMTMKSNWVGVQLGLFLVSFMVTVNCYHDFFFYEMGFMLGMDYLGYIMVCLSSQKVKTLNNFYSDFSKVNLTLLLLLVIAF